MILRITKPDPILQKKTMEKNEPKLELSQVIEALVRTRPYQKNDGRLQLLEFQSLKEIKK
jgi:hypothetical protein